MAVLQSEITGHILTVSQLAVRRQMAVLQSDLTGHILTVSQLTVGG